MVARARDHAARGPRRVPDEARVGRNGALRRPGGDMNTHTLLAYGNPGALGDWRPLLGTLGAFAAVVVALVVTGKQRKGYGPTYLLPRISASLERITGLPGWAAASVGTATFGLFVAGLGFYNDVAWPVGLASAKDL